MTKPWVRQPRKVGIGTFKANALAWQYVAEVLESGWISYGEKSKQFERDFSAMHDCKYGVLSNSGTSSLHVALQALKELHGWEDGSEVLVPASTFVATINVVLHNNLIPRFVDIELETYGMDHKEIYKAVSPKTKAIIPVHLYGQPCNLQAIKHEIRGMEFKIIEDSCESMFVVHHGEKVGSLGDIACFSLYNAHILTAGVGGIATTNSPDYAMKMRSLVNHGLDLEELNTDEHFSPRPAVGRSFRFTHAGHSFRITELEAALALAQLQDWKHIIGGRRRNAKHLRAGIRRITANGESVFQTPITKDFNSHSWMMFPIICDPQYVSKKEITAFLNTNLVETRDMMPVINQPIYEDMLYPLDYPNALWVVENGFYIGCHQDLQPDDIEYVLEIFRKFVNDKLGM